MTHYNDSLTHHTEDFRLGLVETDSTFGDCPEKRKYHHTLFPLPGLIPFSWLGELTLRGLKG